MDKKTKTIIGCVVAAFIVPLLLVALFTIFALSSVGKRVPVQNAATTTAP